MDISMGIEFLIIFGKFDLYAIRWNLLEPISEMCVMDTGVQVVTTELLLPVSVEN